MGFELSRIRKGEWIVGVASLALLIMLFAVPWYGFPAAYSHAAATLGAPYHFSGWESLTVLRFPILLLGLGGVLAWYLQGRCLAPALPVCAIVLETALGLIVTVWLYFRTLISLPGAHLAEAKPGAFVALTLAVAVLVGGYLSLREDGAPAPGSVMPTETLGLAPRPGAR